MLLHHSLSTNFGKVWGEGVGLITGALWFGPAAVIIFFVISGFCIHKPYVYTEKFTPLEFYTKRFVRLLLPLFVVLILASLLNVDYSPINGWVTWSLVCEAVYYSFYPLIRKKIASKRFLLTFFLMSVITVYAITQVFATSPTIKFIANILIYFYGWLLGCYLAEIIEFKKQSNTSNWHLKYFWRITIIFSCFLIGFLHYKEVLRMEWGLTLLPIFIYFWLKSELLNDVNILFMSSLGLWSYSLYLIHPLALLGIRRFVGEYLDTSYYLGQHISMYFDGIFLALTASFFFYITIEGPSHKLARFLGEKFKKK